MAWLPFSSQHEAQALKQEPLSPEDVELGAIERHVKFVKRRKLCFMYFIDNAGDTLTLHPRSDLNLEPVKLPATKGKMLIFRCDLFRLEFNPKGEHLTLLAWVLEDAPELQMLKAIAPRAIMEDVQGLLVGPRLPTGERPHIMGVAQNTGANCHNMTDAMNAYCPGTDGQISVPHLRFDVDLYFSKQGMDDFVAGQNSYHRHGSMLDCDDVSAFDNVFFGIPERQAIVMNPNQRKVLEVGYEALVRGGHTKASLKGSPISFCLGEMNNDWWVSLHTRALAQGEITSHLDTEWLEAKSQAILCSRLHYIHGMTGPVMVIDTACSAGLVGFATAMRMCKGHGADKPGPSINLRSPGALAGGCSMFTDAIGYIGPASQHMNSIKGRCFTYDQSAEGFARGEGVSISYSVISNDERDVELQEACPVGSKVSQDGRSASMTAPNGPAQQMCIRCSMDEAGLMPHDITASECHGTGTALGDPIEVGSLRAVQETDDRNNGLCCTSAKSNLGHLEPNAGTTGIIKCILMCKHGCSHPNVHLRCLNAHLETAGFPSYFVSDMIDFMQNSALVGVNSFGASGTNSHAEIFGFVKIGPYAMTAVNPRKLNYITLTCPVTMGPIDHVTGEAVPRTSKLDEQGTRVTYQADCIRDELAPYDISSHAYQGGFRYRTDGSHEDEDNLDIGCNVSICGSWTGFTQMEQMEVEDDNSFVATMVLGDTRCESFYLCMNGDPKMRMYPAVNRASQLIYVQGPDDQGEGKRWMIDGRDEEIPAGVSYKIRFSWKQSRLLVEWQEVGPRVESLTKYKHVYCVKGTWTTNNFQPMKQVEEDVWEYVVKIGVTGIEEFQLGRDHDEQQCIYPSVANTESDLAVYACGPDDLGKGRRWVISGNQGDSRKIRLEIEEAKVIVKVLSERGSEKIGKVWESIPGPERHAYHVVGSWNEYRGMDAMIRDPEKPSTWRCHAIMGRNVSDELHCFYELFQIHVDGDPNAIIYPLTPFANIGESTVEGPDDKGGDNYFLVKSPQAGIPFEIVLDLKAVDRRKIVSCTWPQKRVFDFRDGSLQLSVVGDEPAIGEDKGSDSEGDE
eukprot:CAMPEP_0180696670 /NCGR_PEP_ID=MMETSP1038_2-20121128/3102_1 /TAXON_ID=632150 /ORGANISM="Azadinium spinosum, Strain 3D9" /LENGTH=1073 /DNA_ID=CAMNT_0022728163 /DNA_START=6 /DNA_END=3227 /DNA_ORIENTATION=-